MSAASFAWVEAVGWVATATFVASYLCSRPETLARVQMTGALIWMAYGALVRSPPVVVANVLVVLAAAWKSRRPRPALGAADGS